MFDYKILYLSISAYNYNDSASNYIYLTSNLSDTKTNISYPKDNWFWKDLFKNSTNWGLRKGSKSILFLLMSYFYKNNKFERSF